MTQSDGLTPVLDTRGEGSLDWPEASYEVQITRRGSNSDFRIESLNSLKSARALDALIQSGKARWILEARSSNTYWVRSWLSDLGSDTVTAKMSHSDLATSGVVVWPGLLAHEECELATGGLHELWKSGSSVTIPKGRWLVRGSHSQLTDTPESLITFRKDRKLTGRALKCVPADRQGEPHYEIRADKNTFEAVTSDPGGPAAKAATLAALTAALSRAVQDERFTGEEPTEVARQLEQALRSREARALVPGDDDFDPLYAATVLVGAETLPSSRESGAS